MLTEHEIVQAIDRVPITRRFATDVARAVEAAALAKLAGIDGGLRDIKDRAALEAACQFIEEKVKPRRCDSDGVSNCWRCTSVFLASRMRELLSGGSCT